MHHAPRSLSRHITSILALGLAVFATPPASAEDFARGKELYDHHCQACHEDLMHGQKLGPRSLEELRERIKSWATHTGNDWSREEIDDVLHYLNKRFYKFEQKAM